MKKVMGNMSVAHRMVADTSQEMITLLDEIELPLWMKLADMTMRPLVLLEIPEVAVMCEEAKQMSKENQQHWNQATKITDNDNNGSKKSSLFANGMEFTESREERRKSSLE